MYYTDIRNHFRCYIDSVKYFNRSPLLNIELIITIAFNMLLMLAVLPAQASDSFQHKVLFEPSDSMLLAEEKGRIMIYDGLHSKTIDKAMDQHFNRIENMMFVRTRHTQDNGEEFIEDDCD